MLLRISSLVAALCVSIVATAQEYKPGDKVVVIDNVKLRVENAEGKNVFGLTLTVEAIDGDWLWLGYGKPGWLEKVHVVPFDQAIDHFTQALAREPNNIALRGTRAILLVEKGELDIAIADFTELIRLDPNNALHYGNRGNAWLRKREYDKAIDDCNEYIRRRPDDVRIYNQRGNAWLGKGEYDKAIDDYNQAIRLAPEFASPFRNRGDAWIKKGENDKAIADYSEAIRIDPKLAIAYRNRGNAWKEKGAYDKVIDDYNQAIRLNPKDNLTLNSLAWLLATAPKDTYRNGTKAVELAQTACELTGWKEADLIDTLAAAYAESGNFEEAVKCSEKLLSMTLKDDQRDKFTQRLKLYQQGQPYHEQLK